VPPIMSRFLRKILEDRDFSFGLHHYLNIMELSEVFALSNSIVDRSYLNLCLKTRCITTKIP
jgi:hypothetical protein